VLAFWAGVGTLAATAYGWSRTSSWWQHLDTSRHVALTLPAIAGLVFMAAVLGTQVVPMTRILEGYWSWRWIDKTAGRFGKRRARLSQDPSPMGYLREYLAFAPAELGPVMPSRLGGALRAAESYPGGDERWGLDAVFWWPRLCLLLPDSARNQVDEARASMDQSASQRNALTIGAPSAAVGVVDVHQDQLAVAGQYAATAADGPSRPGVQGRPCCRVS
jgi:hypothetical protein